MARESWAKAGRDLANVMARAGASRQAIREALTDWVAQDPDRAALVIGAWTDKVAADALSNAIVRPTAFHPRASTAGGRTPVHPTSVRPSDHVADLNRWLTATEGIAERRAAIVETRNALQQGLVLWPDLDVVGGCADILRRLGWDDDRIALVLDITAEAA